MRSDPYRERARALAVEAGLDPDAKIDRPGLRPMPLWCTFRDAARKEHLVREAEALSADAVTRQQAPRVPEQSAEDLRKARRRDDRPDA